MRSVKGTLGFTHEPDGDDNPFLEREENGAPKVTAIDYNLDYSWSPGDPGCRYTKNGDGWPPTGPEVEWFPKCVLLTLESGEERKPTAEEAKQAEDWLENYASYGSKTDDRIYELICEEVDASMEYTGD